MRYITDESIDLSEVCASESRLLTLGRVGVGFNWADNYLQLWIHWNIPSIQIDIGNKSLLLDKVASADNIGL